MYHYLHTFHPEHKIDIHILVTDNDDKKMLQDQLSLLEQEPVNVYICQGIVGDMKTSRLRAINVGNSEFFGWVDPDDLIVSGSYQKLLDIVSDKDMAWMNERVSRVDRDFNELYSTERITPHHIHIVRRDKFDPKHLMNTLPKCPDAWTYMYMNNGVHLNEVGYIYRRFMFRKP